MYQITVTSTQRWAAAIAMAAVGFALEHRDSEASEMLDLLAAHPEAARSLALTGAQLLGPETPDDSNDDLHDRIHAALAEGNAEWPQKGAEAFDDYVRRYSGEVAGGKRVPSFLDSLIAAGRSNPVARV